MKIKIRKKIRSTSKSESKTIPDTVSPPLTLAPPLTPLPNLNLTRSPSLDRPGATRQSKIDRPLFSLRPIGQGGPQHGDCLGQLRIFRSLLARRHFERV